MGCTYPADQTWVLPVVDNLDWDLGDRRVASAGRRYSDDTDQEVAYLHDPWKHNPSVAEEQVVAGPAGPWVVYW